MISKSGKLKGMALAISLSTSKNMENIHSYPGCSFIWNERVVYFTVKHSFLCNKEKVVVYS